MGAINKLKLKAIEDYDLYLKQLNKGYNPSYEHILSLIFFIETYSYLDNPNVIYEYLINV